MSKIRKILLVLLTTVCVALCVAGVAACSGNNWRKPDGGVTDDGRYDRNNPNGAYDFYYPEGVNPEDYVDRNNRYVINTVSMGGMPLDNILVTVSQNGSEVVEGYSQKGVVEFGIPLGEYTLSYADLPYGYSEDENGTLYKLTPSELEVRTSFTSSVINAPTPDGMQYKLGDVMYNFRVSAEDTTKVLSDILEEKRLVVLNFWATWCAPCRAEFPHLNEVYKKYAHLADVVAISTSDTANAVKNFRSDNKYEFFMAKDNGIASNFDTGSIPVSIFIDRYGVVAQIVSGSIPSTAQWEQIFQLFTDDDYEQKISYKEGEGGKEEEKTPTKPGDNGFEEFDQLMDTNEAYNQAFLDASMVDNYDLTYYGPEEGSNDATYNWPFKVMDNDQDGMYIAPSNSKHYVNTKDKTIKGVDNSWSIINTDIELEEGESLSVEVRFNLDDDDYLYIIVNKSRDNTYSSSGATSGWEKITLVETASRHTNVNISILFMKDNYGTTANEFVGLRNLKVEKIDENTSKPLDVRTEVARENEQGYMTYIQPVLKDDGFFHIVSGENDSILFVDVLGATLWSDRHIPKYKLTNTDNTEIAKSVYNLSYWKFRTSSDDENNLLFAFGEKATQTIIDCFYIQDGPDLVAVTPAIKEALDAFVKFAASSNELKSTYVGGVNDNTWLELCAYYRTLGPVGSHEEESHAGICRAHNNPAMGKNIDYAIELNVKYDESQDGLNVADTNKVTSLNYAGGLFYKLKAEKTGVYRIKSIRPPREGDTVDPKILVWKDSHVFAYTPLVEQEDSQTAIDFWREDDIRNPNNFNILIYLKEGEIVYPQITTRLANYTDEYNVVVEYLGEEHWEFKVATTGYGMWSGDSSAAVYMAVGATLQDDGYYHHMYENPHNRDELVVGSVLYIDFIHNNYYDSNNHSLRDIIENGYFNLLQYGKDDYTSVMWQYYYKSIDGKDESDPMYGMIEADADLVDIISEFTSARDAQDGVKSGIWEAFAYYFHYYGPEAWKDVPEELLGE